MPLQPCPPRESTLPHSLRIPPDNQSSLATIATPPLRLQLPLLGIDGRRVHGPCQPVGFALRHVVDVGALHPLCQLLGGAGTTEPG
eukprot:6817108-Pyramimonas_sp.AAC.1